jgi:hypothetical protein
MSIDDFVSTLSEREKEFHKDLIAEVAQAGGGD